VPDKSEASYRVQETFFGIGLNTAIGRTSTISGDLFIDRQRLFASRIGPITVDISKLKSDEADRDDNIRHNWLESAKYPQATFVTKRLEGLPDGPYTEGQELTFKIVGDLTVRTVTKEVTWDAKGKIQGGVFTGTATTNFNMTDFGFDPPEIARTLKAENGVIVEMKIEAQRAP
jgi:polyisoprenoid-binding protein YceI